MVQLKTLNDITGLIVKNRTGLLRMQSPAVCENMVAVIIWLLNKCQQFHIHDCKSIEKYNNT